MASRFVTPVAQYFDGNGVPRALARLWFCEAGTNTFKTTYSDEGLSVANANPVVADANGDFPEIWGTGLYKVRLLPPDDFTTPLLSVTPIWTRDRVSFDGLDLSGQLVTATGGTLAATLADRFGYLLSPRDLGASDGASAAANSAAFAAFETVRKGENIDLQGLVYPVTSAPNGNQYYHGGFSVGGTITTLYDKPYDTPFGRANISSIGDWDIDTFPEALIDMEDGRLGVVYRAANDHGLINGAEKRIRITNDLGATFQDSPDEMIYRNVSYDNRNSVGLRVANGRTVILSIRRNEALVWIDPVVVYSDDPNLAPEAWTSRSITPPSVGYDANFHGSILRYPSSVGGSDTQGWITFPYAPSTGWIDAVYTKDNWDSDTWVQGVMPVAAPATQFNENAVVRLGTQDKWIAFVRSSPGGLTAKAFKSTDLLNWTGPYDTGLPMGGNPPQAIYEYGRVYFFCFSRSGRTILPNYNAHLMVASAEADALWNNNVNMAALCGWQVVSAVPDWASGYLAVVKQNNRWHGIFKCGEVSPGGSAGPKSSMMAMITPETPAAVNPYGLKRNIPGENLLINSSFTVWQRQTTFAIASTTPAITADGWGVACDATDTIAVTQENLSPGEYEVYKNPRYFHRMDSGVIAGTNQTHYVEQKCKGIYQSAYRRCTLSFVARIDGTHDHLDAIKINQNFGTGGGPSSPVSVTVKSDLRLYSQFTQFAFSFVMPRIVGKTFGSDDNPYLSVLFYPLLGSGEDYVFDLLWAKLEIGPCATQFVPEDDVEALRKCQQFYFKTYRQTANPGSATIIGSKQAVASGANAGRAVSCPIIFPVTMYRGSAPPTVTVYSPSTGAAGKMYDVQAAADINASAILASQTGVTIVNGAAATDQNAYQFHVVAEQAIT